MVVLTTGDVDQTSAPSIAPIDQPIDLVHLHRMTLGERSLEREVLQLFGRQADMLIARMRTATPAVAAAAAHTLNGRRAGSEPGVSPRLPRRSSARRRRRLASARPGWRN